MIFLLTQVAKKDYVNSFFCRTFPDVCRTGFATPSEMFSRSPSKN
ncbi:Uncharacterized protein dnm_087430 [Desulfonema magnum]|uniref:Uncharacterized protein n=1 Tax=Desulfonema magnum TaxID=45655 RepID=A0A975BVS0_9BACT|nr:Uncharacterized protein dnm_087430 [Desulfonema magnum]